MMTTADTQRIAFWDIAKFVAIFLVVWGHSLQNLSCDDHYWLTDNVSQVIISFHMPLFMIISGYFAFNSLKRQFFGVMFNKFRQLIVPSISWFLIISAITMVVARNFSTERISEVIISLLSSYWFLKSLFMCYLITMLGALISHKRRWLLLPYFAIIVIMGEQLNYVSTISMLPFFLSGLVIRKYHSQFFSNKKIVFASCVTIYCVLMLIFQSSDYNIYIHPFSFGGGYKQLIVRTIIGLSGAISVLLGIRVVGEHLPDRLTSLIARLGSMTLGIYCVQVILAEGLYKRFANILEQLLPLSGSMSRTLIYDLVITPMAAIICIAVCCAVINLLRRSKYTSLILLGERR